MINSEDLTQLAKSLRDIGQFPSELHEACLRSSASRAYYSSYHCALELSKECPEPKHKIRGGVHKRHITRMIECPHGHFARKATLEMRRLGNLLNQLKDIRTDADYRLNDELSPVTADLALNLNSKIIQGCARLTLLLEADQAAAE